MKIACIMLVGPNERERYFDRCIKAAAEWCDTLVVQCDGAEVQTANLAYAYADVYRNSRENLFRTSEHLARNELLALADEALEEGDIVVTLDSDEEVAESPKEIRQRLKDCAKEPFNSWRVQFWHLWNTEGTLHRVDGMWQPSVGPRIHRHSPGIRVQPLPGAWVCMPLPPTYLNHAAPYPVLDILHWSYAKPEQRPLKHERYTQLVGHHPAHVNSILTEPTLQDVPEFP